MTLRLLCNFVSILISLPDFLYIFFLEKFEVSFKARYKEIKTSFSISEDEMKIIAFIRKNKHIK